LLRRHKIKNQLRIGCSVCRESLESLSFYLKSQLKVLSNALAPFYIAGRMVYILPAKEKKKTCSGKMFFIVPEAGLGPMGLFLHLEACFPLFQPYANPANHGFLSIRAAHQLLFFV
jgi:hypothetical protein